MLMTSLAFKSIPACTSTTVIMFIDLERTNGSFQNQTTTSCVPSAKPKATRKRGAAAIRDVTNFSVPDKRVCARRAEEKCSQALAKPKAPRGNPQAAVQAKKASVHDNDNSGDDGCESNTLRHLVRNGHETLVTGQECINAYIERNTEYEMQKAFVIQVFITSILTWKLGILDAIQKAADVSGFSVWSVRKWVSGFLQSIEGVPLDDIDDETVTLLLSSERGKTCKNPGSLINDEEFRLKAREFVRSHAYKRGEPNLTADMFNAWMKETYKLEVCSETARVWLHNLGFSQKNHHKSVCF